MQGGIEMLPERVQSEAPSSQYSLQGSLDSVRVPSISPSFFLLTHSEDFTPENLVSFCSVSIS